MGESNNDILSILTPINQASPTLMHALYQRSPDSMLEKTAGGWGDQANRHRPNLF